MSPDRYLRSFDVLNLLVRNKEGLRLTEIKDALNLPVSSVHNMMQTMVAAEVATVSDDLRYSVGPRAVALALSTLQSLDIRVIARRFMQDLVKKIGDDVYLGVRVGKRVMYADRYLGSQRIALDIRLGESLFLHSTATGKLFAALDPKLEAQTLAAKMPRLAPATITEPAQLEKEFRRIRDQGYSKSAEESVEGIIGYAFPVHDGTGNIIAAIHASVLAKRATKGHESALRAAALDCAAQIEKQLGNAPEKPGRSGTKSTFDKKDKNLD